MMKWTLILLPFLLTACNKQLEEYVKEATPSEIMKGEQPPTKVENSPMSLKLTPGRMNASATNGAIQATVTPTNRKFSAGADMAVSLTLSRTRVSPQ